MSVRSKRKKEKRDGDPRRRRRPESTVDVDHRALRRGSATGSSTALTSGALAFQFDSARRLASSQVDDFRRRRSREALFGVGEKGSAGVPLSRSYLDGHGTLLHRSVPVLVCVPVAVHLSYLFFVFVRASAVAALFCLLLPPSSVQFSGLPLSQQPGLDKGKVAWQLSSHNSGVSRNRGLFEDGSFFPGVAFLTTSDLAIFPEFSGGEQDEIPPSMKFSSAFFPRPGHNV